VRSRILLVLSLVALALPALGSHPVLARTPAPARSAPAFTLPTRTGTVSLDSLRGKVVLVDFWASWCAPCRKSFPWLRGVRERYAARGFEVLAINLDKEREQADAFLAQVPAPFLVAFDPAAKTAEAFHVAAMPSSFLVGPTGIILYSHAGFDPAKTGELETLIQEACTR
jgi:thiol-disulfide isomerase/thioredoxin